MRIKVDKKDFIKFCIAAVVLLYICSLVVINVSRILAGEPYTFWPFEAFTSKNIGATLVLYFAALLGIFFSVNSYIFEGESGFGITFQGKNNGYARWATKNEVKKQLKPVDPQAQTADAAGIPVINDGKTLWVDNGEAHNIVIGATGSGKTQAIVFPMVHSLAKNSESMIITDPKGEIYEKTGEMLRERGYNIVLLNFRNPQNGNGWNPMALPYSLYKSGNTDKAIELLEDLALNILYEEKNGNADPFWEKSAADYFTGLALGLFEDAKESQINLNSMNLMSSLGEERFGGPNNNYMKEYFNAKDPSRPAYINASGVVFTAEETKQGVLATFKQKIKIFSSRDNLSAMLSESDFDMKDIGRQKTAVFMIVQDEKKTLHSLATIFIKQCYETLIDVAQTNPDKPGKLPYRTNFILDEFANMPPLKDVTTMVTAARSRLIRFTFIIQNYAQLTQVYGKENGETIKGNCNITYLISSELSALEELSKLCGDKIIKVGKDKKEETRPLVTVSDLQRLKQFETIIIRLRTMPFKTKLTPDFQMNWGKKYPQAGYPQKEKKPIDLFDIREFVKEQKKQKMNEMMGDSNQGGIANPFGSMSGMGGMSGMPNIGGGMMNPLFGGNPMMGGGMNSMSPANDSLNVDDLVKRIDAKIAELEEEERLEKEKQEKATATIPTTVPNISEPIQLPTSQTPSINQNSVPLQDLSKDNSQKLYDDDTDSERFFDDFFSDE